MYCMYIGVCMCENGTTQYYNRSHRMQHIIKM